MITQLQAFSIAKSIVPDIELRGVRISDQLSDNKKLSNLPKNCWYISYANVPIAYLSCSKATKTFLCISKNDGEVKFHRTAL
ncbi:MAG TPA: hypothetical protein PKE38_10320 [Ignavibacteriaceae bacterium]|nr:hypothetical protein [Ignavibacteriaceae bacterium]